MRSIRSIMSMWSLRNMRSLRSLRSLRSIPLAWGQGRERRVIFSCQVAQVWPIQQCSGGGTSSPGKEFGKNLEIFQEDKFWPALE